jgi:hypothetical protein
MHAVRVHHHQRADRHRLAAELVLALQRVLAGIGHGHGEVRLAGADELQVGDRAAGHLRRCLHAVDVLRQHGRHAAAQWVVHPARAAGADGDVLCLRGERESERAEDGNATREKPHVSS